MLAFMRMEERFMQKLESCSKKWVCQREVEVPHKGKAKEWRDETEYQPQLPPLHAEPRSKSVTKLAAVPVRSLLPLP
jgi:hypothetical protein